MDAQKLPYKLADLAHVAIDAVVRKQRPNLPEGRYTYLAQEVYQLLCCEPENVLQKRPPDFAHIESEFVEKVEACLVKLEISTGRMVLYERVDDGI